VRKSEKVGWLSKGEWTGYRVQFVPNTLKLPAQQQKEIKIAAVKGIAFVFVLPRKNEGQMHRKRTPPAKSR